MAASADYYDSPISWGKHLEGLQGYASEHTPVPSDVCYGRTHSNCSSFFSKEPVAQNVFTRQYIVDMEGTDNTGKLTPSVLSCTGFYSESPAVFYSIVYS